MVRTERRPRVKPAAEWTFPAAEKFWLSNGVELVVSHRPGQHVAAIALVLDAPLSLEPGSREGVAVITQRCLDEGSQSHPGAAFGDALENIGATMSGTAAMSASILFVEVPVTRLADAVSLLLEAVSEPEFAESDIARHKALRLAEIDQIMASSSHRARLAFRAACVPGRFRESRPAGGSPVSVASLSREDVVAFHQRHYRPDAATLIISGDLTHAAVHQAREVFETWQGPANPAPIVHQSPTGRGRHLWLIDRPGAVQADIRLGRFGIDRSDPRWADIQVATYAMGGAFLSRLNRVLREELGYTYGAHLVNTAMRSGGLIAVQGSFRTEVVADAISQARQILDLTNQPFTAAEVSDAVNYSLGVAPLRYSTAEGVTDRIAQLVADGVNTDFVNTNAQALSRVTPESATRSLSELLPVDQLSLVVVGDAAQLERPLQDAGWPVRVHD